MERLVDITLKQNYNKARNTSTYEIEFIIPNLNADTEMKHSYTDALFTKKIGFDEFQNIILFHDLLEKTNIENRKGVIIQNCKCEYGIRKNIRTGLPYKAIFIQITDDVSIAFFASRVAEANINNVKFKTDYIWEETAFSNNAVNALEAFEQAPKQESETE